MTIATLGIVVDGRQIDRARQSLDRLTVTGAETRRSVDRLNAGTKNLDSSLRNTASRGLAQYSAGAGRLAAISSGAAANIGKLAAAARVAAPAVAVLGAAALGLTSFARTVDTLGRSARTLGVSVQALSELGFAARQAGVETSEMEEGLRALTSRMADAARGSEEAASYFRALDIEVRRSDGSLRPVEEVLGDIADRFARFPDGATKSAFAIKLFNESGAKLIPLLNGGRKGLDEAAESARKFGLVFDDKTVDAARDFARNLDTLKGAIAGLRNTILGGALESVARFAQVTAMGVEAAGSFGSFLYRFATELDNPGKRIDAYRRKIEELNAELERNEALAARHPGDRHVQAGVARRRTDIEAELERSRRAVGFYQQLQAMEALEGGAYPDSRYALRAPQAGAGAPALPSDTGSGRGKPARLQEIDDQASRTRQAVADLITQSEIVAAREYLLTLEELDRMFFDLGLEAEVYDSAVRELTGSTVTFGRDGEQALRDQADAWLDTVDPMREFIRNLEQIDMLTERGFLTPEQAEQIKTALGGFNRELSDADAYMRQFYENAQRTLGDGLYEMMQGNFDNIGAAFSAMVQRMIAEAAAADIMRSLFGGMGGGGGGGLLGGLFGKLFGGFLAEGGPADPGRAYIVGERGPELFVPKAPGTVVPNGGQAGLGAASNVSITQNIHVDSRSDMASVRAAMEHAKREAQAEIMESMRRGGAFAQM